MIQSQGRGLKKHLFRSSCCPKVIYKYVASVKDKVRSFSFVAQKARFELKMLSKKLKRHKGKVAEGRLVGFPIHSVNPTLRHTAWSKLENLTRWGPPLVGLFFD